MKLLALLAATLLAAAPAMAACDYDSAAQAAGGRYVIHGDSVYDSKTNLTWARCSVGQTWVEGKGCAGPVATMGWDQAEKQGANGWRLPTRDELLSLILQRCRPTVDRSVFPNMDVDQPGYWSASTDHALAIFVDFGGGAPLNDYRNHVKAVRLVRSGQ